MTDLRCRVSRKCQISDSIGLASVTQNLQDELLGGSRIDLFLKVMKQGSEAENYEEVFSWFSLGLTMGLMFGIGFLLDRFVEDKARFGQVSEAVAAEDHQRTHSMGL